jgi:ribonuclease T
MEAPVESISLSAELRQEKSPFSQRFRRFLPVIVDIETSGIDPQRHAILEIAAVLPTADEAGRWHIGEIHSTHVIPFSSAELDPLSLAFNRIDPIHPFRQAVEEREALETIFQPIRLALERHDCVRAVLVGHNVAFDLGFLNAAVSRAGISGNPFHAFTSFDTATLSALMFGQTVLAKAAKAAGLEWDNQSAHSALYDAERTAQLFCWMVNRWADLTMLEQRHQTRLPG